MIICRRSNELIQYFCSSFHMCSVIKKSKVIVPLLSRKALEKIRDPSVDSSRDNFLRELQTAVEMNVRFFHFPSLLRLTKHTHTTTYNMPFSVSRLLSLSLSLALSSSTHTLAHRYCFSPSFTLSVSHFHSLSLSVSLCLSLSLFLLTCAHMLYIVFVYT